ncbi:MAG TPA: hypothetical protein VFA18_09005, partial [Gemmataceae bacterium]|nr:hypothetical protein [Gemmataceae bacterium]
MPWIRCPHCQTNQLVEGITAPVVQPCAVCGQPCRLPATARRKPPFELAGNMGEPDDSQHYMVVPEPVAAVRTAPTPGRPRPPRPLPDGLPVCSLWVGLVLSCLVGVPGPVLLGVTVHLPVGVGRLGCGLLAILCLLAALALLSRTDLTDCSFRVSLRGQPGDRGRWTDFRRRLARSWWWWIPESPFLRGVGFVCGLWIVPLLMYICWPDGRWAWPAVALPFLVLLGTLVVAAGVLLAEEGIFGLFWLVGGLWVLRAPFGSCKGQLAGPAVFTVLAWMQIAVGVYVLNHANRAPWPANPPVALETAPAGTPKQPEAAPTTAATPAPSTPHANPVKPTPAPAPPPPAPIAKPPIPPPPSQPPTEPPKKEHPKAVHKRVPIAQMPGLLGYWTFDEGRGKTAADTSGQGHVGRLVRAGWMEGIRGRALRIRGKISFFDYGKSPDFNFGAGEPFTIAGWVRTRRAGGTIVSQRHSRNGSPVLDIE